VSENLPEMDEFSSDPWIFSCWTEYTLVAKGFSQREGIDYKPSILLLNSIQFALY